MIPLVVRLLDALIVTRFLERGRFDGALVLSFELADRGKTALEDVVSDGG
jgi:hypothetical protein